VHAKHSALQHTLQIKDRVYCFCNAGNKTPTGPFDLYCSSETYTNHSDNSNNQESNHHIESNAKLARLLRRFLLTGQAQWPNG